VLKKRVTITFMSGGIHFTDFDNAVKRILLDFSRKRIQWTTEFRRGRPVRKADKVFAASNNYRTEFFFHRQDWEELEIALADGGIKDEHIEVKQKRYKKPARLKVTSVSSFEDRDYQAEIVGWAVEPSCTLLTLPLQTGKGKAQPLTTPIKTPHGDVLMGDLSVGDELLTREGNTQYVTGVFPQGKKDVYRITFQDGRTTECCDEHLWRYYNPNMGWQTTSLKTLLGYFERDVTFKASIPLVTAPKDVDEAFNDLLDKVVGKPPIIFSANNRKHANEVVNSIRRQGGIAFVNSCVGWDVHIDKLSNNSSWGHQKAIRCQR